jgi:hypothetical protein
VVWTARWARACVCAASSCPSLPACFISHPLPPHAWRTPGCSAAAVAVPPRRPGGGLGARSLPLV